MEGAKCRCRRDWRDMGVAFCLGAVAVVLGSCSSGVPMPPALHVASITQPDPWKAVTAAAQVNAPGSARAAVGPLRAVPAKVDKLAGLLPKGGGYMKIGRPYTIGGVRYVPRHDSDYQEIGIASWYGNSFHGKKTANGELYDMHALTAAHRTLPLPSMVSVTNVRSGKTVIVRVNDRGPFRKGRIIDVSAQVAKELGFAYHGVGKVRVKYLGPAPLNGDKSREKAHLASLSR